MNWIPPNLASRITSEEFSKDSLENITFSICRFHQVTASYPKDISVIGFAFKANRFTQLHFPATVYPSAHIKYIPIADGVTDSIVDGPYQTFKNDLYGCEGDLKEKREKRNPFKRFHGYEQTCPEMKDLLDYCGKEVFSGPLPWRSKP